ncbi:MAG: WbqC family protein [Bacteroidales bacterium]|jgi:hypothetical protein|nr:WbqC family protein [Bacteroidales bacterium]
MKLAGNQPFFFPYIAYFQLMKHADLFMFADDFQFSDTRWTNRNKILLEGKEFFFTLTLHGASQHKNINEIYIDEHQHKIAKQVSAAYKKAPFFNEVFPLFEKILAYEDKNLARFVANSLVQVAQYLKLDTQFVFSSEIQDEDRRLKAQERVFTICKALNATSYINLSVEGLYSKEEFKKQGIDFYFLKSKPVEYTQFRAPFIPHLSMLDVLMFNSVAQVNDLLMQFELI